LICSLVAAWTLLVVARADAQVLRTAPPSEIAPGTNIVVQPGAAPLLDDVAPGFADPYVMPDDIGPFETGLGWTCGGACPPSWRGRAEWLYFSRNRGNDSLSSGFRFDNLFDYEHAGRFTLDRRYDCTHGWEIVYAGPFEFEEVGVTAAPGTLNAGFIGRGIDVSAFFGADLQQQRYESRLQSVEAGYKSWGWNVIAVSWGGRYLNVNDDLRFVSVDSNGDLGLLDVQTNNDVMLGQIGVDMLFPLGRWSLDATWKGAIGANFGMSDVLLRNAGVNQINRTDQDVEFAALIESGTYLRYFITRRLTARIGYEFWWIHGVGLASRQFGDTISRRTGREFVGTNELFYFGASGGLEFVW
jgi:hypothetical protein